MCKIEEKMYTDRNGSIQYYDMPHPCPMVSRSGQFCKDAKRTRYQPPPLVSHDQGSSPVSTAPSTPPTGTTGGYIVQTRRPSDAGRRSSISEKSLRPEIIITLGSSRREKDKKYGSSKTYKRSSLSGSYVGSNDYALDSPGSDASYTMRTGLPDSQIDTIDHLNYNPRPLVPNPHHGQHHGSSASSFTSSQTPSLVAFSDPESPTLRQFPRYPTTIVHQQHLPQGPGPTTQPVLPTVVTSMPSQSRGYRTHVVTPAAPSSRENVRHENIASTNVFDYQDRSPSPPLLPPRNATAPVVTQRGTYRDRVTVQAGNEPRSRQEAADYEMARRLQKDEDHKTTAKAEEAKQVRFELGRHETRAEQREENKRKEKEKDRRERERERERERGRQERQDQENQEVQKRERQKREEILQRQKERELAEDREELERKKREDERKKREDADRLKREEAKLRQREREARAEREEREEREREREREREHEKRKDETRRKEKEVKRLEKEVKVDQTKSRGRRENRGNGPPLSGTHTRTNPRRRSLSRAEVDERKRLLDADNFAMKVERDAADQREREEQAATLIEQQQKPEYYDPRGGNRQVITNEAPNLGRRNSVATRTAAIAQAPPPSAALGRRESQRRSSVIVQHAPPNGIAPINTSVPPQTTQGHMRPPPSATRPNPPQFLAQPPTPVTYVPAAPNPSARHHSYGQGGDQNPFAQPPGRLSNTSQDNPYSQPARLSNTSQDDPNPFIPLSARHSPNIPTHDPWDARDASNIQAPVMHTRQTSEESQNTLRRRGEEYLARTSGDGRTHAYDRARTATHKMHHAYENDGR